VVAAAEVDVLHPRQDVSKGVFHRGHGPLQAVGVLLAEVVPVQAADPVQPVDPEVGPADAQARAGRAGVVQGHRALGMLGVDAQAEREFTPQGRGPLPGQRHEPLFLGKGVEHQVVAGQGQGLDVRGRVGGGEAVHLAAELLAAELRLVRGTAADPVEHLGEQREHPEHGKALERQQDAAAGARLDPTEHGEVVDEQPLVDHEGRRLHPGRVEPAGEPAVVAFAGHSSTACQGRP
jgi:hypothetical protein